MQFAVEEILHLQLLGDIACLKQLWGCAFCMTSHQGYSKKTLVLSSWRKTPSQE
jgi:hypothetical protein